MVRTPQRGRRADAPVSRLSVPIDAELKHALKQAALDERTSVTQLVTTFIKEAIAGARRPPAARAQGSVKLDMNIDPALHARLKRAALDADLTVSGYLTGLIIEAVSAAQEARGGER